MTFNSTTDMDSRTEAEIIMESIMEGKRAAGAHVQLQRQEAVRRIILSFAVFMMLLSLVVACDQQQDQRSEESVLAKVIRFSLG